MIIKDEFKKLISCLQEDELKQLEENIIKDGCISPLIIWGDILIDGHNRYEICTRLNIKYDTQSIEFNNDDEAKEWIIMNQFGRRNLSLYERGTLSLDLKNILSKMAKDKQIRKPTNSVLADLPKQNESLEPPINTRKEISIISGVKERTLAKIDVINKIASSSIKDMLKSGEISIDAAYNEIKKEELQKKQEEFRNENIQKSRLQPNISNIVNGDSRTMVCGLSNIKCVITDSPYGQAYISNRRIYSAKDVGIENDQDIDTAISVVKEVYEKLYERMSDNSFLFSFIGWKQERYFMEMIEEVGFTIRNSIIWVKNNHGSGDLTGSFSPRHERIIMAVKGNPKLNFRPDDVQFGSEIVTNHPTSKPIDLLKVLIESSTNEGDIIVDPFAGHGSTGIAAIKSNRNYWLCELDEFNYSQIKINIDKWK